MIPAIADPRTDLIWEYVCCEDDRAAQLAVARNYGYDEAQFVQMERTRDFMVKVYEARKEYIKQKALAQIAVNQDDMYELATESERLSDKVSLHNVLLRLADLDKPQQGALGGGGSGFVLTINLPGAGPIQMQSAPVTIDMPAAEDDLPPTPSYLARADNPDILTPLLDDLELA